MVKGGGFSFELVGYGFLSFGFLSYLKINFSSELIFKTQFCREVFPAELRWCYFEKSKTIRYAKAS